MKRKLFTLYILIGLFSSSFAQNTTKVEFITDGKEKDLDAKEIDVEQTDKCLVKISNIPDLSGYDRVSVYLEWSIDNYPGAYFYMKGADLMNSLTADKNGNKFLALVIYDKTKEDDGSGFTVDTYPFVPLTHKHVGSKVRNNNLDSYEIELNLVKLDITGYEKKWDDWNDKYYTEPIYGNRTELISPVKIKVNTSSIIPEPSKPDGVGDVNELNTLIGAANEKTAGNSSSKAEEKEVGTEIGDYKVGDQVKGNYNKKGIWFKGKVDDYKDGKYHVVYDDGYEEWLSNEYIKPFEKKSAKEKLDNLKNKVKGD